MNYENDKIILISECNRKKKTKNNDNIINILNIAIICRTNNDTEGD